MWADPTEASVEIAAWRPDGCITTRTRSVWLPFDVVI
jgi:hypothetical protein